jgi:pimeloyl-ACP methyl ester carboxylesterase
VTDYLVEFKTVLDYDLSAVKSLLLSRIGTYPDLAGIVDHATYGVKIYKITYKTTCYDSSVMASGLLCVPVAEGNFPIISFQNGTNTDHDNAPTVNLTNIYYMMMEFMASNGYIVLITDYLGFGKSEDMMHPYYHRTPSDNSVIDLIHAFAEVQLFDESLAKGNDTLYLMGYSQGGWATASAFDQLEKNNEDFVIGAVSCGAGAYDLMAMSEYVLEQETFPSPMYLPYFIYSHQVYGNVTDPLSKFFNEPYAENIPGLFDGSYNNGEINVQLTNVIPNLITADMVTNFSSGEDYVELRDLLMDNSITGWNTSVKINLYHGSSDDNVPPQQSSLLYDSFIHAGTNSENIHYYSLEGLTHESGLLPWGILTVSWFNELENK